MKIILPGATGQFGEALLLRMLTEGHTVFGFARDQEKIKKTLERISNALPNVITEKKLMIISADIADETLAKRAVEWLGGCDMYVNNVGIFKFDDKLSPSGISEDMLIQTNVHANKKFLNQII